MWFNEVMLCVEELRPDEPKCPAAAMEVCSTMCEPATQQAADSDRHRKEQTGRATSMNSADRISPCIRLLTLAVGSG